EVRFKDYGLKSFEVIDNGNGIAPEDYEPMALGHHTSRLASSSDLNSFGFRGEAPPLLSEGVNVTTATSAHLQAPMGVLTFDSAGHLASHSGIVALAQRETTITLMGLITPLHVRRKELERHAKQELRKALYLLTAYALVLCTANGETVGSKLRGMVNGGAYAGKKTVRLRTDGATSIRTSVSPLWGSIQPGNLPLSIEVVPERAVLRHREGDVRSQYVSFRPTTPPFSCSHIPGQSNACGGLMSRSLSGLFTPGAGLTRTDCKFFLHQWVAVCTRPIYNGPAGGGREV
ncbi:hypothetical protein BJY52DRAFT_1114640, partial [Lactarius psammicola]